MAKILVTGGGGFIGSHLCEALVGAGHKVKAFVRYNGRNHWGWLDESPLKKEIEVVTGDLRDYDSVYRSAVGMEQIFHLGALIGIPYSYESPLAYIRTNVEGTYNILESARQLNVQRVVVTSTSEVYGTALYTPIDEKHPLQPQSPYSASKIGADNIALSYWNSFKTPVVVARPFNTYGPRQSARAIIPTIIGQLVARRNPIKLGSLTPVRDLTFVNDTVSGMIAISKENTFLGQSVNIGTGAAVSVKDMLDSLCKILGFRPEVVEDAARVRPENSEVHLLLSNNQHLQKVTGWKPSTSLMDGLEKTVEWFKLNQDQYKVDLYNV